MVLGDMSYQELIITDLGDTVLPSSNLLDPANDECEAKKMDTFMRRVADVGNSVPNPFDPR